jgi:hypothetical protein
MSISPATLNRPKTMEIRPPGIIALPNWSAVVQLATQEIDPTTTRMATTVNRTLQAKCQVNEGFVSPSAFSSLAVASPGCKPEKDLTGRKKAECARPVRVHSVNGALFFYGLAIL